MDKKAFYKDMMHVALPVTIQSLLQAILSLIDQIMIGGLGSASIAGVGLATKFISLFTVTMTAIVTVAGIMIAQYQGKQSEEGVSDSFFSNLYFALDLALLAFFLAVTIPQKIMGIYTEDVATIEQAAIYLKIMALGFIPQTITLMLATVLRNVAAAKVAMIASGISVVSNTILNYLLIFGVGIFPKMDVAGAALATSLARIIELIVIYSMFLAIKKKKRLVFKIQFHFEKSFIKQIGRVLAPILVCEFLWSLGENVYAIIYGHIGTEACAAMTLTYPLQTIVIGALSGVAASAGIIIGKSLGCSENEVAYNNSKEFIKITIFLALIISVVVALLAPYYVKLFNVSEHTRKITVYILYSYVLVFIAKVINMVLGGGILRSGGQTKYTMWMDLIGTWCIGVPVGYIAAYFLKLPVYYVYFLLSLEEYIRVLLGIVLFKSKRWMVNITEDQQICDEIKILI